MNAYHSSQSQTTQELLLSNGITLGPVAAAGLQSEVLRYNITAAREERNFEKECYLKHLLVSKINVPSNNMLSKAGKFFNFRNIGYEIINQQNKTRIADVIESFDARTSSRDRDADPIDVVSHHNNNLSSNKRKSQEQSSLQSHWNQHGIMKRSKSNENKLNKKQSDEAEQQRQQLQQCNTKCLQFKQEKQAHLTELKQQQQLKSAPNALVPSASFTRQGREQLDALNKSCKLPDESSIHFAPSYAKIHATAPEHTFLPVPSSKRREDVNTLPDCIIRGNLCEYQIRNITTQLKQYSARITGGLEKLTMLEKKLAELKSEKFKKVDFQKVKLEMETIVDKKRAIGEDILEAQKAFIAVRTKFEEKVRKNIDAFELEQFFKNQKIDKQGNTAGAVCNHVDFKTMLNRAELFPAQNVEDICERLFNNFEETETVGKSFGGVYFEKQIGREEAQRGRSEEAKGPNMTENSMKQFERIAFAKTPCFAIMKTPRVPSQYAQALANNDCEVRSVQDKNWKRVVEGTKVLSNYHSQPMLVKIEGYTPRQQLASHQIRSVRVNENFHMKRNTTRASSSYQNQRADKHAGGASSLSPNRSRMTR